MKKALIFIIILGALLRFTAVNWDSFGAFHPDERNISWAVTRITFFSRMDPKFFAYGGLPIYLYRALGEGVVRITGNPVWLFDWGHIAVIGRYVSATLSTISIWLLFLVGATYFSPAVGIVSAALLAFSPWAVEQAHFQTTETMLVFFVLLLSYFSHSLSDKPAAKNILRIGIIWGLALAAKTTSLLFGAIPLAAIWIAVLHERTGVKSIGKILGRRVLLSALLVITTVIVFFCFSPYTVLDFRHFNESMMYESGVALGRFTVPYTLQFLHTTPYLYQLTTMLWQAGPLVIVGLAGLVSLVVVALQKKKWQFFVFLVFPIIYLGWVGTWFAKFSRYNVPFLPFVTVAAAWVCIVIMKRFRMAGYVVTAVVFASTMMWGLANFTVYLRPQTKAEATRWIVRHIPANSVIYTEHWNDGLPLETPDPPSYRRELLTVYDEPDDAAKRDYYANKLSAGDYIILSTRRIWATMPRLGEKYPVTSLFYTKLLNGTLGYKNVATFTSYPQLLGVQIQDDSAEESLQVFDHPTVLIFQNTEHVSKEEMYFRLMSSMGS